MKRTWAILLLVCLGSLLNAQTSGTLTVKVMTSSTGGNYAPKNIVAIWIEDSTGKFVKTLLAYANTRKTHLNTWEASSTTAGSAFNTTDATTGATQSSHGTRTCQWNGTNYSGNVMPDGNYKVRMELTDKNATGNTASFTFIKGPNSQTLTPANVPSFSSISLNWITTTTGLNMEVTASNTYIVYPNPGKGKFTVLGENIKRIEVTDLTGKMICKSILPVIDLTAQPNGLYLFSIHTDKETVVQKIRKD
ncbi:MAG TPA: DUF2271 domain-containing protein [Prolixibacteraceae bacterium]|jgi:hypothetical protein